MTDSLDAALRGLGVRCTVEERGPLAIVTPAAGERAFERAAVRRRVLCILRAHGFTHAALELADDAPAPDERSAPRA